MTSNDEQYSSSSLYFTNFEVQLSMIFQRIFQRSTQVCSIKITKLMSDAILPYFFQVNKRLAFGCLWRLPSVGQDTLSFFANTRFHHYLKVNHRRVLVIKSESYSRLYPRFLWNIERLCRVYSDVYYKHGHGARKVMTKSTLVGYWHPCETQHCTETHYIKYTRST